MHPSAKRHGATGRVTNGHVANGHAFGKHAAAGPVTGEPVAGEPVAGELVAGELAAGRRTGDGPPDDEIAALRAALAQRDREIAALREARQNHADLLNTTIFAMQSSHSWRITAPLRALATRMRRLLPRRTDRDVPQTAITPKEYGNWILTNDTLSEDDRRRIRGHIASSTAKPKFSILIGVHNPPAHRLRETISSVTGQLYGEWELCLAGDAATSPELQTTLLSCAGRDDRIKVRFRDAGAAASPLVNTALDMAAGDYVVLMDEEDILAEHALYLVADAVGRLGDLAIIYSDEDHIDSEGRRSDPYFKPDWDYELFLGHNLVQHQGVYRTDLARAAGGFREGLAGAQDLDFALRVLEAAGAERVHHIPFVLYHRRQASRGFSMAAGEMAAGEMAAGQSAAAAACQAVCGHLARTAQAASEVTPLGVSRYLKVKRLLPRERPLVSVIIPTKNKRRLLEKCIDGLVGRTSYEPREVVIVDNGSTDRRARKFLAGLRSRPGFVVVEDNEPFNFSRLVNRGVAASSGEVCVLLNNDVDVINTDWLDELTAHALRPDVGAVGAKLYYGNGTLQHGGVILGIGGVAGHQHRFARRDSHGYFGRLSLVHGLSCVTAACLAVRRAVYDEIGGFDERNLAVTYNDVDFCLRLRQAGYRIIWTPQAQLYHYESVSRGSDMTPQKARRSAEETSYMQNTWSNVLYNDPFYNPNLTLYFESYQIASKSRARKPWLCAT